MEEKRKVGRPKGRRHDQMNKAEKHKIIKESIKLILDKHYSWTEYVEWVMEQGYSKPRGNQLWIETWEKIRERFDLERDKEVDKHLYQYWQIYDKAMEKGDYTNARQTLNDIAKLKGLNEAEKMDITTQGEIRFNFGDE